MSDFQFRAAWWRWWGNPLVNMHSDQKKKFDISSHGDTRIQYQEVESLRATLALPIIPEKGICDGPMLGLIILCDSEDLLSPRQVLPALTFDESVLKFTPTDWAHYFQIKDKDHIRALIAYSRSAPEKIKPLIDRLVEVCNHSNRSSFLTLEERMQVVLSVYFSHQFPEFTKRLHLNFSDSVLFVLDHVGHFSPEMIADYCSFIESSIKDLVQHINQRHQIPELDFENLTGQEAATSL